MTQTATYSAPSKILHWLTVLLLALQFAIGWLMPDVHRGTLPVGLIQAHLIVGVALIFVVAVRIAWRWMTPGVAPLPNTSPQQARLAAITHQALYVLLIAVPVLGWINASARGWAVTLFGVIPMPKLAADGSSFGHLMGDVHQAFAWVLLAGVALHVAAALYHHFVVKDGTLGRMK
ncbi:MAG: cytochrome b [Burkholderiales bacterium]|nr:cytochrome b [Burkholderiales bacterium]